MKARQIVDICKQAGARAWFQVKKYSPELCLVGGLLAGGTCIVLACKASMKVPEVVEEHNEQIDEVETDLALTDAACNTAKRRIYISTGMKLVKLYVPAACAGAASTALLLTSYGITRKRNGLLAASLAATTGKFEEYRKKVVEEFGEETDLRLAGDLIDKKLKVTHVDEETGEVTEEETGETVTVWNGYSRHARFWGVGSKWYDDVRAKSNPNYNPEVLLEFEDYFNQLLRTRGYLFLNDVYDHFGWKKTFEGQNAGWIYDPKKGNHQISFGLRNVHNKAMVAFMNGEEPEGVWVDFNCSDYITDKALQKAADIRDFYEKEQRRVAS